MTVFSVVELHDVGKEEVGPADRLAVGVEMSDRAVIVTARNLDGVVIASVVVELLDGQLRALVWDEEAEAKTGDPAVALTMLATARKSYLTAFDDDDGKKPPLTEAEAYAAVHPWPPT